MKRPIRIASIVPLVATVSVLAGTLDAPAAPARASAQQVSAATSAAPELSGLRDFAHWYRQFGLTDVKPAVQAGG
ncbi:MAG TPA: hypothetical protein VGF31_03100 [Myxococcaceae bacterium]|jgi:hypothetical protein